MSSSRSMHNTSTSDTTSNVFSRDGSLHVGTLTLEQWKANEATTVPVHHVRCGGAATLDLHDTADADMNGVTRE